MSVYKEPFEWVEESINSILRQTFTNFEFLIVNDNPENRELTEFLCRFENLDNRIIILKNSENIGLTKSLNKAIEYAKGEYIARMDADDISMPDRLDSQVAFMDSHFECGVCGSNVQMFGLKKQSITYPHDTENFKLYFESPFAHPSVIIRKSILREYNIRYNESLRYSQDYDLWVSLAPITSFANINRVLLKYRVSNQQITKSKREDQYEICTKIRTRAFNKFCEKNNLSIQLVSDIDYNTIREFKEVIQTFPEEDRLQLLYYLYRSVTRNHWKTLRLFFTKNDICRFGVFDSIKIIGALTICRNSNHFFNVSK